MRQLFQTANQAPTASRLIPFGYALLGAWVALMHWRLAAATLGANLAASDPPAHFVSGVMVYEYLRDILGGTLGQPVPFAESFYVRYPKVAIGHWPPAYYGIQALWYGLFGPTVDSALALSAVMAALLALLLFRRLRPGHGASIAAGAALMLLALPWIQRTAWAVMSDLLTGLFVFLALLAFSDLLENPRSRRAAAGFSLWSILAVLTKGTAWALGPFALLAPILAGRMSCFRNWRYWGAGVAIVALGAPFYLLMGQSQMGYPAGAAVSAGGSGAAFNWMKHLAPLLSVSSVAPPLAWAVAGLGLARLAWTRWKRHEPAPGATDGWVAAAWILAQAVFLFILPLTGEPRALVPALAPLALLMAHALGWLRDGRGQKLAPVLPLLIAGLVVVNGGEVVLGRVHGYREAARAIPAPPEGVLILVGSDPAGEGAFIVERLMGDERRAGVVLRAGQWLAESNWMGTRHKLVYEDAGQVRQAIQALPVQYVVIDTSAEAWPEQSLLREAVAGNPGEFRLMGRFPVSESPGGREGELQIYENPAAGTRHPELVRVRLGMERNGRVLEYRWPTDPK